MKVLTELGFDTGFPKGTPIHHTEGCRYEWPLRGSRIKHPIPYIIKEPQMCTDIDLRINKQGWQVEHIYILLREPGPRAAAAAFIEKGKSRGGAPSQHKLDKVERWFTKRTIQLVHAVAGMEIPHTMLSYPYWATNSIHLHGKLKFLMDKKNISSEQLKTVMKECVDPAELAYARKTMPPRNMDYMKEYVS